MPYTPKWEQQEKREALGVWYCGRQAHNIYTRFAVAVKKLIWSVLERNCGVGRLLARRLRHHSERGGCLLTN
jgi:hypothetical protein